MADNNFSQLVADFEQNVDDLNQVLSGDESSTVTIGGVQKPTISKALQDKWNSIEYGIVVFATHAELDAYTPLATEEKGSFKVTNDPDSSLNGYYSWVSDTTYTKDADLVVNAIDANNTSDAVSGSAVADYSAFNYVDSIDIRVDQKFDWGGDTLAYAGISSTQIRVLENEKVTITAVNSGTFPLLTLYDSTGKFISYLQGDATTPLGGSRFEFTNTYDAYYLGINSYNGTPIVVERSATNLAALAGKLNLTNAKEDRYYDISDLTFTLEDGVKASGAAHADYESTPWLEVDGDREIVYITNVQTEIDNLYDVISRDAAGVITNKFYNRATGSRLKTPLVFSENTVEFKVSNDKRGGVTLAVSKQRDKIKSVVSDVADGAILPYIIPNTIVKDRYIDSNGTEQTLADRSYAFYDVIAGETVVVNAKLAQQSPMIVGFTKYGTIAGTTNLPKLSVPNYNTVRDQEFVIPEGWVKMAVNTGLWTGYPAQDLFSVTRKPQSLFPVVTSDVEASLLKPSGSAPVVEDNFQDFYNLGAGIPSDNIDNDTVGIIIAGQSNTVGAVPSADFPSTWEEAGTQNYSLNVPFCQINENDVSGAFVDLNKGSTWGYDVILQNKVANFLGENFYCVKRARNGTRLQFSTTETSFCADLRKFDSVPGLESQIDLLEKQLRTVMLANSAIKFKAFVWHQGESDYVASGGNYPPTANDYYRHLCQVIYYVRGIVKNPRLPFIFGTIPATTEDGGNSLHYNTFIDTALRQVADNVPDCHLVDLFSYKNRDVDPAHFTATTAEYFGDQIYQILKTNNYLKRAV